MATVDATTNHDQDDIARQLNDPRERVPLVLGDNNFTTVTDKVTEIALRVGFYDHSAFSRKFSQVMGVTPRGYRKKFKQPG